MPQFMNRKALPGEAYIPTEFEHIANVVTHAGPVILTDSWLLLAPSCVGLLWMAHVASTHAQLLGGLVFGAATFILFAVSTTFHTISYSGKFCEMKEFFHIGDRAVIYLFIAASYTPWLLLKDMSGWNGPVLVLVWLGACLGILYQYTFHEQYKSLETALYVLIGTGPATVCVLSMRDVSGMPLMYAGGATYLLGVVFFKCDGRIPCAHAIWHCFVFVGVILHYVAVCKHLLGKENEEPVLTQAATGS